MRYALAVVLTLGILSLHAQTPNARAQATTVDSRTELNALLDEDLATTLRRNPITATVRGIPGYNDLLPDLSLAELDREHARERRTLERLKAIDPKSLSGQDRIS